MLNKEFFQNLDADNLEFLADRYDSACHFSSAICEAQSFFIPGTVANDPDWNLVESFMRAALAATMDDGADYGTIPCLDMNSPEGKAWGAYLDYAFEIAA